MQSSLEFVLLMLGAAVIGVVIFRYLQLPSILGYLAVGIAIGPHSTGLVSDAQSLTAGFIADMKAQIKALRESMCAMGDSLYYSVGTAPSMHQSMMRALAAIVYEVSDAELGVSASMKPWEATINRLDISEDSKTFIGVKPLTDREAKAPRAPLDMGYPPVREIFHFDDYDYENADVYGFKIDVVMGASTNSYESVGQSTEYIISNALLSGDYYVVITALGQNNYIDSIGVQSQTFTK